LSFSIGNKDLAGLNLWDGDGIHGLDYITRPTARGTEHYFSFNIFHLLKFGEPGWPAHTSIG
jgi:hypothetical protein